MSLGVRSPAAIASICFGIIVILLYCITYLLIRSRFNPSHSIAEDRSDDINTIELRVRLRIPEPAHRV